MSRYHITKKGNPGKCTAQDGNCPLGGEGDHFASPSEAREAFEAAQESSMGGAKKPSVEDETEYFIAFVKAKDLRVGDDYEGSPITAKKIGSKWVTIATEATPKHLISPDETVAVQREQATAEARTAMRSHDTDHAERKNVERRLVSFDLAQQELNEHIEKYGSVRSGHLEQLIKAQVKKAIAEQVLNQVENYGLSYSDAAQKMREAYKERLVGYASNTGLSRSTSMITNVMEDAQTEGMIEFIREGELYY